MVYVTFVRPAFDPRSKTSEHSAANFPWIHTLVDLPRVFFFFLIV